MLRFFLTSIIISFAIYSELMAATSLKVIVKDEAVSESNMIKPRFYIENTGDEVISNFTCKYSFSLNEGKTPVVEDYYTPVSSVSLESNGNNSYTLVYNFSGITLEAGDKLPDLSGNVVGVHYSDWSDISMVNPLTAEYAENSSILVYDENGNIIGFDTNGFPVIIVEENITVIDEDGDGKALVIIDATQSYDIEGSSLTYSWWQGNGSLSSDPMFNIELYVGDGYHLELKVTDEDGNQSTVAVNIAVLEQTESSYDLAVYTRCFDLHEDNVSKQRMYIQNNGENELEDFTVRYYFSIRNSSVPIGEFWYTPKSTGKVVSLGNNDYYLELDFTGNTLLAGRKIPHSSGNVFAYHLPSWASIEYDDDFSFTNSTDFELNEYVTVHDKEGNLIYGNAPESSETEYLNQSNMYVVNPVVNWVDVHMDDVAGATTTLFTIYDSNGNIVFVNASLGDWGFNADNFEAGEVYSAEVVVDGVVDARASFYIPAE